MTVLSPETILQHHYLNGRLRRRQSGQFVEIDSDYKVPPIMINRTKDSGHREVPFKTEFPPSLGILLNPIVMQPFH